MAGRLMAGRADVGRLIDSEKHPTMIKAHRSCTGREPYTPRRQPRDLASASRLSRISIIRHDAYLSKTSF